MVILKFECSIEFCNLEVPMLLSLPWMDVNIVSQAFANFFFIPECYSEAKISTILSILFLAVG